MSRSLEAVLHPHLPHASPQLGPHQAMNGGLLTDGSGEGVEVGQRHLLAVSVLARGLHSQSGLEFAKGSDVERACDHRSSTRRSSGGTWFPGCSYSGAAFMR